MTLSFDPRGDFELIADGLEKVQLRRRDGNNLPLEKCLRRQITRREVQASNGHYRYGDSVFHLSTSELDDEPRLGDAIETLDAGTFTVLSVERQTLSDRWRCVGRNLQVSEALNERVTILVAGELERNAYGAVRPSIWIEEATDVIARVQPTTSERRVEHDQAEFPDLATCVLLYSRDLDNTRRIRQADGTLWKIERVGKKDRIDVLMEAELIRTPWPLS